MASPALTPEELRAMFEVKLKQGIPNPPGEFHPLDLERVKDDHYLRRVIIVRPENAQVALDLLWHIMIWRKTVGANDFNENNLRMDYVNEGFVFPRGRDNDGFRLLIFMWKKHAKGTKDIQEFEKILIYWLDRLDREENGNPCTLFFDTDGAGLNSVDMNLINCIINLFKLHYPFCVNSVIIYQLPWILYAAFKVVKALLPAKAMEIVKIVRKDNLKDVVPLEQTLTLWGGTDDYTFEFVPEKAGEPTPKIGTSKIVPEKAGEPTPKIGTSKIVPEKAGEPTPKIGTSKIVPEKPGEPTPNKVSLQHIQTYERERHTSLGETLRLVPNDVIIFKEDNDQVSGQFTITNMAKNTISFKVKTTSPEKFRVRPSSGTLSPGTSQTVLIIVQQGFQLRTVSKDRFLVMSVQIPKTDLSPKELLEVWQNSSGCKVDEYRLKCQIFDGNTQENADSVVNALNDLQVRYETLNNTVKIMQYIQFFMLLLILVVVGIIYLIYQRLNLTGT